MQITSMQLYWLTRLDSISNLLSGLIVLSGTSAFITFFVSLGFPDEHVGWYKNRAIAFYASLGILFPSVILGIFVPDTKEAAAIYVIPKIVNNQQVQAIPSKILDLATDWLDELKPRKK